MERLVTQSFRRCSPTASKILLTMLALPGCDGGTSRQNAPAKAEATAMPMARAAAAASGATDPAKVGKYGAPLGTSPTRSLASVLGEPARFAGQSVRVEGHVKRACSAMGCWMELAESAAPDAPACRVIMKGHAFFVPTDSAGASARVEGTLDVRRIEPAQVAHMEGEGAQFPQKAADGSAQEVRFVASGVELWRGS